MENIDYSDDLLIDISEENRVKTIKCTGHIDSDNYQKLSDVVANTFKTGCFRIVMDLSDVKYISSAGWGIFVGNLRKAEIGGGTIRLAGMQQSVKDVYDLLDLGSLLQEFKTVKEAARFN